ncbi:MAG: DUF349 domain-containing protein [Bacteroidales bacterium]|nr:DUF349 domain-containing protein [Bacteroidales bacterium]
MDNKDQLNQIPGEEINESRDEKTSQTENQTVEAPPADENQEEVEMKNVEYPEDDGAVENEKPYTEAEDDITVQPVDVPEADFPATNQIAGEALAAEPEKVEIAEILDAEPEIVLVSPDEEALEKVPAGQAENEEVSSVADPRVDEADEAGEGAKPQSSQVDEIKAEAALVADSEDIQENEEDDFDEDEVEQDEEIDFESLSREELVEKLEEIVAEDDVNKIKSKVAIIKVSYLKKTKAEKEAHIDQSLSKEKDDDSEEAEEQAPAEDLLEVKFNELFDIYRQKRSVFLDNLEKEKVENLQKKKDILEALKNLIASEETLKKTYDDFRELQGQWKEIGMVPKAEVNNLWQNYHFLVEKFFDKVKINKELKDLDLKKNLEQKIELCEQAEELLLENSIIRSFKELQRLHDLWKEIGPVPTDKNEDIWERFKSTTDKINQRRRDHYKLLQDQHDNNYEAKVGLCEKADQLLVAEVNTIREWQNKTRQFNELFRVWKSIGPAAKKQNDEIWERFKGILDNFFNEKKEYFSKLKDQQINNYNMKIDLCVRAEAAKDSTDWRQTSRDLITMQKEWKDIGPVPRKHSDKIWKRFRAACDEFFNNKSNHFAHIRDDEAENLRKKEELIKLVEETAFDGDRSQNLNKLKEFQREWTEIGFVPFKEKDRLQNAFRSAVNKQLDKLNISTNEISIENYKSKMEVLKGSPEGNKSLGRERNFILGKITTLRDDINIWENNIGFLADTKKASLFKDEFEKKIEKAKNELEMLETKLKFLSQ